MKEIDIENIINHIGFNIDTESEVPTILLLHHFKNVQGLLTLSVSCNVVDDKSNFGNK